MDHKDLLNSVVQNMAKQPVEDVQEENMDDRLASCIKLTLSVTDDNGVIQYLVDTRSYDWDGAMEHLDTFDHNINVIRNIMRSLCAYAHGIIPEEKKDKNIVDNAIKELTGFFKMYQIDIDYHDYFKGGTDPDTAKGDLAIAMLMGFDALNCASVMRENIRTYQTMRVMQYAYEGIDEIMHDNVEAIAAMEDAEDTGDEKVRHDIHVDEVSVKPHDDENESECGEKRTYYVIGEFKEHVNDDTERYMAFDHISRIEDVDYVVPDEQYIPEIESVGNTVITVGAFMMAYDLGGCKQVATDFFKKLENAGEVPLPEDATADAEDNPEENFMSSSDLLREFGFDDHSVSGLLD